MCVRETIKVLFTYLLVCAEPIDVIGGSSGSDVSSDDSLDGTDERLVPYTSKMVLVDTNTI